MSTAKVAITLDENLLEEVDELVSEGIFHNRSQAIATAVREKVLRLGKKSLARELMKLDPKEEKKIAEEWMNGESSWPEY